MTTAEDARKFLEGAEAELLALSTEANRAAWVHATYITDDTEALAAQASERSIAATVRFAKEAARFDAEGLPAELARKIHLLRHALTLATPADPKESEEAARLAASLESRYGKAKYRPEGRPAMDLEELERVLAGSREEETLREAWHGWHAAASSMKSDFSRLVELANKGARELGFADTGDMWRSKYDMSPESFAAEIERLWRDLEPLYRELHAYVRDTLAERYPQTPFPDDGSIPAHLLGNMWAQEWTNIYPLVAPDGAGPGYDLTAILEARHTDARQMVRYGEAFFTSLGFPPLPESFWERSMFVRPRDREVVCHASAWDVDNGEDLRLKMCVEPTSEDFVTVHHELGHNVYQRAYKDQPFLFRDSANDGFHEAIGDTIALSITPQYLVRLGFLGEAPDPSRDIGLLLAKALEKIAFLPFALKVDRWRWGVFSGAIPPGRYNAEWWRLTRQYQGVAPPEERGEANFDPGAKYHVAAGVPYARYFLAVVLQFQFHRALTRRAGGGGPLHRRSIYGDRRAGERLSAMLSMGCREEWPVALAALTGERRMDASAILDYFAPLSEWLAQRNRRRR